MLKFIISISITLFMFLSQGLGQEVSDFSLENTDNELVSLEELQGEKLTIIDFWATWCKPCTKAMPKINKIYQDYKDEGLSVIGISCDGPRSIGKVDLVAQSMNIDYAILKDIDCEVMTENNFQAFPTLIILDSNNEIVYVHEGFSNGDEKLIEEEIISLLQ